MHLRERAVAEAGAARREVVAGGNGEVAEGGQDLSGRVALDLAAVLVVGEVAAVVDAVFDAPVGAEGGAQGEFAQGVGRAAGDGKDGFLLNLAVG